MKCSGGAGSGSAIMAHVRLLLGMSVFIPGSGQDMPQPGPGWAANAPALPLDDFITGNVLQRWLIDVDVKST